MSKTIIISSESSNLYTTKRLIAEANKLHLLPVHLNPFTHDLKIKENLSLKNTASHYIFRTTGIRFDDMDLLVAKYFAAGGTKIINPLGPLIENRNKDIALFNLSLGKLPIIETVVFRGKINDDIKKAILHLKANEKYILKMNRGNQGIGVQLINGTDSLLSILETYHALNDQKFHLQPYLPHQQEFRILLTENKILGVVEKMKRPEDFRGNAKRAKTKLIKKHDPVLIELAEKALKQFKYHYAGIDIIKTNDGYKILEVNSIPGFESIEQLSDKNIAKELLLDFLK